MRGVPKTLVTAIAVLLLALGLAACGGGDSDSNSASSGIAAPAEGGGGSGEADSSGKESSQDEGSSGSDEAGGSTSGDHRDSGGGSAQFKSPGGDNSVQEFGEEAGSEEFEAAAAAFHSFLDARAEGDWETACDYLSESTIEGFEKLIEQAKEVEASSCAEILEGLTSPAGMQLMKREAAKADVGALRVEGEQAFLIYRGTDGDILAIAMADEDGDWKVASLGGTPLN